MATSDSIPSNKRTKAGGHASRKSSEYHSWKMMKARCNNPNATGYHRYGGRGIKVCQRWQASFLHFLEDMGPKPSPQHSIDRIDCNGNYEPSNCKWSTRKQQQQNRRQNRMLTYNGETACMREWAENIGIGHEVLRGRLNRGWAVEKALTTPPIPANRDYSVSAVLSHNGESHSISEWARRLGIHKNTLSARIQHGWTVDKALTTPVQQHR